MEGCDIVQCIARPLYIYILFERVKGEIPYCARDNKIAFPNIPPHYRRRLVIVVVLSVLTPPSRAHSSGYFPFSRLFISIRRIYRG